MSAPKHEPLDVSFLNDCRLVAAENYAFYDRMYDRIITHFDKDVLGRVIAQKKEFIDAIEMLISTDSNGTALQTAKTKDLVLTMSADDIAEGDPVKAADIVQTHEARFNEAIALTLSQLTDETTLGLLKHHRDAAHIAMQAMLDKP